MRKLLGRKKGGGKEEQAAPEPEAEHDPIPVLSLGTNPSSFGITDAAIYASPRGPADAPAADGIGDDAAAPGD